jgi:hypothetical protein
MERLNRSTTWSLLLEHANYIKALTMVELNFSFSHLRALTELHAYTNVVHEQPQRIYNYILASRRSALHQVRPPPLTMPH